ncbi:MAG: TIR domain-containing protein [Acetivibrionales bacterium]|jgi:WD40 repeat protein
MNPEKKYIYDAFISYRHTEPDKAVAERLHRLLETFKIPKSIVKATGKKRIQRVFRDRDELPTSSNLAENITAALESSEFLIVVCSPRTPQSQWVLKEIETFKNLRGPDRILALLIEGEPAESFPEQLRIINKTQTMEDGSVIESAVEVEPLAADIRAASEKEMMKKLKTEVLRLLSPMLNCSYDDLKQRHKERLIKTALTASISLSAFFLAFGSFSMYQAFIINQKSMEVNQKAQEINRKNIEINQKNMEISYQIEETLISQSRYLADISRRYYESGDRYRAILAAHAALPKNLNEPDRPYVEEAEHALSRALGVYEVDEYFDGDIVLDHNMYVNYIMVSPNEKTLLTFSADGYINIWNTEDGSRLGSVLTTNLVTEENTFFIDNNSFFGPYNDLGEYGVYACIDINGSIIWQSDIKADLITYNPYKKLIAMYDLDFSFEKGTTKEIHTLYLVDALTGNKLLQTSIDSLLEDASKDASDDISVRCIATNSNASLISIGTDNGKIITIDASDGKHIRTVTTENKQVKSILLSDSGYLIADSYLLGDIGVYEIEKHNDCLEIFPPKSTVPTFKHFFSFRGVNKLSFLQTDPSKIVFLEGGRINTVGIKTGVLERNFISNGSISDYCYFNENIMISSDNDGIIRFLLINENMTELGNFRIAADNSIKNVVYANGKVIFSKYSSNKVYLYRRIKNERHTQLYDKLAQLSYIYYSPDERLVLSYSVLNNEILLWNEQTRELIASKSFDNNISDVRFINNDSLLVSLYTYPEPRKFSIIKTSDLSVISEIQSDDLYSDFCISKDSSIIAISCYKGLLLYSLPELNLISKYEYEKDTYGIAKPFTFTDDNKLFALIKSEDARIIDISTNKVLHKYESDTLKNGVISDDGRLCALSFNDKSFKLFDIGSDFIEKYSFNNLPLDIETMLFSQDKKLLFVQFVDDSVHIYDTEKGSLKKALNNDTITSPITMVKYSQSKDKIALITLRPSLIIDSNTLKVLAEADICDIKKDFTCFLSQGGVLGENIYIVPCYTTEMLLEEANRQLNGRALTEEEKAEMFIN